MGKRDPRSPSLSNAGHTGRTLGLREAAPGPGKPAGLVATLDWLAETMAEGRAWMDSKRAARFLDMREDEFKRIAPRLPRHPIPREDDTRTRRFRYYAPELTGYLLHQHE